MILAMSQQPGNKPSKVQVIEIKEDQDGQRLDNWLLRQINGAPKSLIYRIIRKGEVRVNKGRKKANYRLCAGDLVRIPPLRIETETEKKSLPQSLMHEIKASILLDNQHCLVINKPAGLAVHGGSGLHFGVIDVVKALFPDQEYLELVHRLDRETSGCLMLAKSRKALIFLHEQIKAGTVIKKYMAGLAGNWQGGKKTVKAPLKKNSMQGGERMVEVDEAGKAAISHFRPIQHYRNLTLVEVEIETGRTHQIRVHAAHEGHPVAGDKKYGEREYNKWIREQGLNRMFLHAYWLEFMLPGGAEPMQITTPLPSALQNILNTLEQ